MKLSITLPLAALAAATACGDDRVPVRDARVAATDTARRVAPLVAPRWQREGADGDSTLRGALALAADDSTVYVLAAWGQRLVALDARDGHERWHLPRPDAPLALTFATALARTPLGAVAVLDGRAQALHVVGAEGRPRERIALAPDEEPSQLCARADGGWVLAGGDTRGRLVTLAPGGARDYAVALPWRDVDSLAGLQLQAWLAGTGDGATCAAALRLGRGFVTLRPETPPVARAHAYLEPVALPRTRSVERRDGPTIEVTTTLEDAPAAARAIAVADSTLAVVFEGRTRARRRLVDLYALGDGRYRGSLLHETPVSAVAAWGSRLYVLHRLRGRAALAAYDVPALRDGVPADAPRLSLAPVPVDSVRAAAARQAPPST